MSSPERDPLEIVREATLLLEQNRQAIHQLAVVRRDALRELRRSGMPAVAIAKSLGISRQQVHRLLRGER